MVTGSRQERYDESVATLALTPALSSRRGSQKFRACVLATPWAHKIPRVPIRHESGRRCSLSWRIQLLALTQRTIRTSRSHISANRKPRKPFPTTVKTLGDEIQVKRKESELSARKLAGMLSVPVATVTSWERGQSLPDPAQLALISKLLGEGFRCNPTVQ